MILIGVLSGDTTLDINVHDTYFIISHLHLSVLISILFGIMGFGYWVIQRSGRKLSKWLNWTHILLTFGGILVVLILSRFYSQKFADYEFNMALTQIINLIILLIIIGQLVFPINIVYGLLRKKKQNG